MRSIQMNNDFDFDTDTSYLQQDDAFSVNEMLSEWPTTMNAFVKRLANTLGQGAYFEALRLQDFMDLVGSTAVARPRETVTYEVHLRDRDTLLVDVAITSIAGTNPPISADNAGFFKYALRWFAKERPKIKLSARADGLFWVHLPE
ncbi:TPA: hypothetical protein L5D75_007046 [Pseudomonas aeruginosa]|jgi:hypothetical protein|nr:hypothetical protein [Pseudomonas aeruginosa]